MVPGDRRLGVALMAARTGQRCYVGTTEASTNWRLSRHGPWEELCRRSADGVGVGWEWRWDSRLTRPLGSKRRYFEGETHELLFSSEEGCVAIHTVSHVLSGEDPVDGERGLGKVGSAQWEGLDRAK